MKQTNFKSLPVIGRVIQNENMKPYLEKFDNLLKGSKHIDIKFVDDNPLSIKRERYNQGGSACYCMENKTTGRQKIKNLWQPIECNSNCTYLQKDEKGKSACNRIAWLKFYIPQIATDRIWLMKITGQESINNLDNYLKFQKLQGNSLNDTYTLFLYQKEQTNKLGQTFNNYLLDILEKKDFTSKKTMSQNIDVSPKTTQTVNNEIVNQEPNIENGKQSSIKQEQKETNTQELKSTEKTSSKSTNVTTKKQTKSKSKSTEKADKQPKNNTEEKSNELDNCYALLRTFNKTILNKGQQKAYLMGEFADMDDKISEIAIKPEDAEELSDCDLGTFVKLDIQEIGDLKFAIKLKVLEKRQKNIAA